MSKFFVKVVRVKPWFLAPYTVYQVVRERVEGDPCGLDYTYHDVVYESELLERATSTLRQIQENGVV